MLFAALGKRYERLLFFTAPLSLAAIVVLLVAIASTRQQERVEARCLATAAKVLEDKRPDLEKEWQLAKRLKGKTELWNSAYRLRISYAWIYSFQDQGCYELADPILERLAVKSPPEIVAELEKRTKELQSKPIEMYGIILPSTTAVDLFGTKVQIDLLTLSRILQVVLLPVLLIWLGSLYTTRYRESILVANSSSIAELFPHVVNLYPVGNFPSARKRMRLYPYMPYAISFVFALIRLALVGLLVLPPVLAYLASLYFLGSEDLAGYLFVAGITVSLFCLSTLLVELQPQHVFKFFPSPLPEGGR